VWGTRRAIGRGTPEPPRGRQRCAAARLAVPRRGTLPRSGGRRRPRRPTGPGSTAPVHRDPGWTTPRAGCCAPRRRSGSSCGTLGSAPDQGRESPSRDPRLRREQRRTEGPTPLSTEHGASLLRVVQPGWRSHDLDPVIRRDPGELGRVGLRRRRRRLLWDERWRNLGEETLRPCRREAGQVLGML
jgi:hypothetical protein